MKLKTVKISITISKKLYKTIRGRESEYVDRLIQADIKNKKKGNKDINDIKTLCSIIIQLSKPYHSMIKKYAKTENIGGTKADRLLRTYDGEFWLSSEHRPVGGGRPTKIYGLIK